MNRLIAWLTLVGVTSVIIFVGLYMFMFLLPLLLLMIGGYIICLAVKTFWLRNKIKKGRYVFESYDKRSGNDKIIDVEYEILDEKNYE